MDLETLISQYGLHDEQFKELKKLCDSEKDKIKTLMCELDTPKQSFGGYTVTRTVSTRSNTDEAKAMQVLKRAWKTKYDEDDCPYVKTVEVLDTNALESALYNGDLDSDVLDELASCTSQTQVVTLKCAKDKKAKI